MQLIAWNVYAEFRDRYSPPKADGKPPDPGFIYDPFFTVEAVNQAVKRDTCAHGWEYYLHRLERYFGPDWPETELLLCRLAKVERKESVNTLARYYRGDQRLRKKERVRDLLVRLKAQYVVDEPQKNSFVFRIGLMKLEMRRKLGLKN